MQITETTLPGLLKIKTDNFEDHRGKNLFLYNKTEYDKMAIHLEFVEDTASMSARNVLRGIHADGSYRLATCLLGKIYVVIVDCRVKDSGYGEWESFFLSENSGVRLLVSPFLGIGHLVLSDTAIFHYKRSSYFDMAMRHNYRWDDPKFNIWWPVKEPILSKLDEEADVGIRT